jgi:Fur family zinc uptake transcriptional regulator
MPDPCHHRAGSDRPADAVARDLAVAEARCLRAGERWTTSRRRTYELLARSAGPVKAYDLIAAFGSAPRPATPPTVYRALDFLGGFGLVHRLATLSAYIACRGPAGVHQAEFLICDCCGQTVEAVLGGGDIARRLAAPLGFRVYTVLLEVRGKCSACRDTSPASTA